jgi:hypothetical protein
MTGPDTTSTTAGMTALPRWLNEEPSDVALAYLYAM